MPPKAVMLKMNRRHFNLVATVIAELSDDFKSRSYLAERMADAFGQNNAHFDRKAFLAACKPEWLRTDEDRLAMEPPRVQRKKIARGEVS